jgi:hypothetical protein
MDENTNKLNVFPTKEQIEAANAYSEAMNKANAEAMIKKHDNMVTPPPGEVAAADEMRRRTEQQLAEREARFAEEKRIAMARREELGKAADAEREYYLKQSKNLETMTNRTEYQNKESYQAPQSYQPSSPVRMPATTPAPAGYRPVVEPQNVQYDLIPIPSDGKIYPFRKNRFKVAYLNASDENLLTSPNILESGDWFETLLRRKILEDIDPKDLHMGDRNAIMIWLRATSYGVMYPINVIDPATGQIIIDKVTGEPWVYEVDLSTLKIKNLGAEPDAHGLFTYTLEESHRVIKFRLLTVRDIEELAAIEDYELNVLNLEFANSLTHRLDRQILEIDGNRDPEFIRQEILSMRVGDSRPFRKYVDEIESGIDLRIDIRTPGGESIKSFLPLNINFFWPDFSF